MSRSPFGWDLPPGCSHRDVDRAMGADARDPNDTEEAVWEILEKAGVPVEVNEQVADILDKYYGGLAPPEDCYYGVETPPNEQWPEDES